jgi:hypothetical protein
MAGGINHGLDATLWISPQFEEQLRGAFRSGRLDAGHQCVIVSLIAGRTRQVLPSFAKRVLVK